MYQIISDGSCDLGSQWAAELGVEIVPFYVSMDGETYRKEIEEVGVLEFYQFMVDHPHVFPKSSLPSVQDYVDVFVKYARQEIPITCICITSKFSGSYNAALNASKLVMEHYPKAKIAIINSMVNTVLQGTLVMEAVRMQREGYLYEHLIQKIELMKHSGRIFFTIGSMDYLVNGGRVGKLAGLAASTLGLRPLIVLKEGEIHSGGVARGRKRSKARVIEQVMEHIQHHGPSPEEFAITVGYGYDKEEALEFKEVLGEKIQEIAPQTKLEIRMLQIGATIGVHTGPHPLGVGILKK